MYVCTIWHKILTGENIDEFDEFPAICRYFPYQNFPLVSSLLDNLQHLCDLVHMPVVVIFCYPIINFNHYSYTTDSEF